jgi:hypothetical protein
MTAADAAPGAQPQAELGRARTARALTETVRLLELHAIVSHHSNGQDGCLYTNEARGEDDECHVVTEGPAEINKADGSFSTNFIRLGANLRWMRLDRNAFTVLDRTVRAEVQWHPKAITSDRIEDQYGRLRFIAAASYMEPNWGWCSRSAGASVGVEYITVGRPESVDPFAFTGTVSCHPTVNGGWGLFARFYSGQDYYNLGFLENIRSFQAGFTYSSDGFFRVKR